MAATRYTVEEFVNDFKPILESEADVARLLDRGSSLLERLIRNPDCIPEEYRVPAGEKAKTRANHGTYLLYKDPDGLSVSAVVWGPDDHLGPHDHHTWGMIGVLTNALQETRYRRLDDGSRPDYAHLEKGRMSFFKSGEVTLLVPGEDEIHQIDNFTDRPTAEIHVYGQDLIGLQRCRFDVENRKATSFISRHYDNV